MKTTVAVLRGGPSNEYDVSLKTGGALLRALDSERFVMRDIFIDKSGQWHLHGMPQKPASALTGVDVALNAMHGEYGEDGTVQRLLETLGVPYTGSGVFASATAFNKHATKQAVAPLGVKIPYGIMVTRDDVADGVEEYALELFRKFPMPAIIKPVVGGSSVGMMKARSFHELVGALAQALGVSPAVLVEQFVRGREATVGVVEGFRGEPLYALLPVEIIPPHDAPFFDYESKYSGVSTERCPGNFTPEEKRQLSDYARRVHEGLGLSHYSRSDFILTPRGIYFLEVNTLPGLTEESLLPKSLVAVGSSLPEFAEHLVSLAQRTRR